MQTQQPQTEPLTMSCADNTWLCGISSSNIDSVWSESAPFIERALKYSDGRYFLEDVYCYLKDRDMQLWNVYSEQGLQCCCVTEIRCFPRKKVLVLVFVAGVGLDVWSHHLETIEAFGKANGCSVTESISRVGFEKKLPALGFKKTHSVFIK